MTNIKIGPIGIAATIGALALLVNALNKGPSPLVTALAATMVLLGLALLVWALAYIAHQKGTPTGKRAKKQASDESCDRSTLDVKQ
jgi:hypothetical protein